MRRLLSTKKISFLPFFNFPGNRSFCTFEDEVYTQKVMKMSYAELVEEIQRRTMDPHVWTKTSLQNELLTKFRAPETHEETSVQEDEDEEDGEDISNEEISSKSETSKIVYRESRMAVVEHEIKRDENLLDKYPHLKGFERIFKGDSLIQQEPSGTNIYIENYSEEELQNEFLSISPLNARRELVQFSFRSRLFSFKGNFAKKLHRKNTIDGFYQAVRLEREYKHLPYRCNVETFRNLKETPEKVLMELKDLSNFQNFLQSRNTLLTASEDVYLDCMKNLLLGGANKFDIPHLEYILVFVANMDSINGFKIVTSDERKIIMKTLKTAIYRGNNSINLGSFAHVIKKLNDLAFCSDEASQEELDSLVSIFIDFYHDSYLSSPSEAEPKPETLNFHPDSFKNGRKNQKALELSELLRIFDLLYVFYESKKETIRPVLADILKKYKRTLINSSIS